MLARRRQGFGALAAAASSRISASLDLNTVLHEVVESARALIGARYGAISPVTSIKGSTATVLGASPALDPAEMREFFRIIDEQADHMRGLISDLLDAGRIDTGTLSVAPEPSEVAGLADQARNTFLSGGGPAHRCYRRPTRHAPYLMPRFTRFLRRRISTATIRIDARITNKVATERMVGLMFSRRPSNISRGKVR